MARCEECIHFDVCYLSEIDNDIRDSGENPNCVLFISAADMVEVVRCKNCVYFKQSVSAVFPHTNTFVCDYPYGLQKNVSENDFCCHGAKLKGGE